MNKLLVVGITGALAGGLALAASAQTHSAKDEISTAHAHAVLAQSATSVAMAHTHLHHVINCLVGPNGSGFEDRKSTRLNSSHPSISYAVFCLKKKTETNKPHT